METGLETVEGVDFRTLTLKDALDLAILMEEEARDRYQLFARTVGGRYAGDASDMCRMMAGNEAKHRAQLAERRQTMFGTSPVQLLMLVALDSERKAEAFFQAALPHVHDPQVRELFLELAAEERRHQALVQSWVDRLPRGPDVEEDEADAPGSDPGN